MSMTREETVWRALDLYGPQTMGQLQRRLQPDGAPLPWLGDAVYHLALHGMVDVDFACHTRRNSFPVPVYVARGNPAQFYRPSERGVARASLAIARYLLLGGAPGRIGERWRATVAIYRAAGELRREREARGTMPMKRGPGKTGVQPTGTVSRNPPRPTPKPPAKGDGGRR